jgi:hypothetical protein
MNKIIREPKTRDRLIDLLHSINKKVNKLARNIENNLPVNLEELNDIRVLTSEVELLDKTKSFKQTTHNIQ